jgi:hypothetical protein
MHGDRQSQPTHRRALDADERPSRGVYTAVAEARDCSPLDLSPLADAVDPDALDALLTGDDPTDAVAFEYCGYEVRVTPVEVRVEVLEDA